MSKHPLFHFFVLLFGAYAFYTWGIGWLSKPIPATLVRQYMGITLGVLLLYMAAEEQRWQQFQVPIWKTLRGETKVFSLVRNAVFIVLPVFAGWISYQSLKPQTTAPPPFRTVHPANPESISFAGKTIDMTSQQNPLRADTENFDAHLQAGKKVYYERCFFCHGDTWQGDGHFAPGFVPTPAKFTGDGTLAILTEAYVFWRIAKGGPGLPREATPWDSAMPAWEDRLTEDEIWSVILYLYDAIGKEPRAIGAAGHGDGEH